jgi:hypothetical protein
VTLRIHWPNRDRTLRHSLHSLALFLAIAANLCARDEWFRGLDLEPRLSEASLVLVGRVLDVSETRVITGGKFETSFRQFKFAPLLVLKGVFSRDSLSLTSQDLGLQRFSDFAPLEVGQVCLLMLGRTREGYAVTGFSMSRSGDTASK